MPPDESHSDKLLRGRGGMYRLLSRLWWKEADEPLLARLRAPELNNVYRQAGGVLPDRLTGETLEELAVDYCRLFVGPSDHLPPVQSVWQHGQFQSHATTSMRDFLELAGYAPSELPRGLMPDHLAIQCDLAARLLLSAAEDASVEQAELRQEIVGTYFQRHLAWTGPLTAAALQRAETPFYRAMIRVTRDFLAAEASELLA